MTKTIYILAIAMAAGLGAASTPRSQPLDNGLTLNGLSFNGLSFNGRNINGRNVNGTSVSGSEPEVAAESAGLATSVILKDGEQVTIR